MKSEFHMQTVHVRVERTPLSYMVKVGYVRFGLSKFLGTSIKFLYLFFSILKNLPQNPY